MSPWHFLFRLTIVRNEQLTNLDNPGDRTLALLKGNTFYHFNTYTCTDEENTCDTNVIKNIDYEGYVNYWTYFYFGYNGRKHEAYAFVRFKLKDSFALLSGIRHFTPTIFNFYLQKDEWHDGFSGTFGKWAVNFGDGSYLKGLYWEGESKDVNFAYAEGSSNQVEYEEWSPEEEEFSIVYDEEDSAFSEDIGDTDEHTLNGILEYGIGFWSKFLFNGKKQLIEKPDWMGLVRVATHRDFQGDDKPGDRTLAVFVGRGFYQFSTYNNEKPIIFDNIAYDLNLDGEWTYIQFGYVRETDKSGKAKGYVYFQNQNIRETKFPDIVLHQLLKDYLYVGIGTSGKKTMALFNGVIR